jgi:hypothetical protein
MMHELGVTDTATAAIRAPDGPRDGPPWEDLSELFQQGKLIPFLGAGASAYCPTQDGGAPPSATELVATLANRSRLQVAPACGSCHRPRFDLARIASYYQTCIATRPRLDDLLTKEIANPQFAPNPLHHLLARVARIQPLLIITTNYDNLLEKAFDQPEDNLGPLPYEVVVTAADQLAYAQLPSHAPSGW